jgi:hypothetical protein
MQRPVRIDGGIDVKKFNVDDEKMNRERRNLH